MDKRLNWEEGFSERIHESWEQILRPFIESEECFKIFQFLKERSVKGHKILPLAKDMWNAFKYCKYDDLKVCIIGYDPYPQVLNGVPVADGLAFSSSNTDKLPDSLQAFYQGINDNVYKKKKIEANKDLKFLAQQGVLLLNVSLTVEMNRIGCHSSKGLWIPLYKHIMEYFNTHNPGLVYIFLGKDALKVERYIFPMNAHIFTEPHPSFFARGGTKWITDVFSKTNKIIETDKGEANIIHWDNLYLQEWLNDCPF